MSKQPLISDYIENISFKKKLCFGFTPDEVYEAIRKLAAMYNDMLGKSYQEIADLKSEIKSKKEMPKVSMQQQMQQEIRQQAARTPIEELDFPAPPDVSGSAFTYQSIPKTPVDTLKERKSTVHKYPEAQLRHMNRRELLDVLLESRQENDQLIDEIRQLTERNAKLTEMLEDKKLKIGKAGTIAEATLLLNGVVESTQSAAQQYLDNLKDLYESEQSLREEKEILARRQAQQILDDATQRCETLIRDTRGKCLLMEEDTKIECDQLRERAKSEANAYWENLTSQLESFYTAHEGLKDLLQTTGQLPKR